MYPPSRAGSGGAVKPNKAIVTIKVELPVMSATKAYEKGLEIAKQVKEDEGVRVRSVSVVA